MTGVDSIIASLEGKVVQEGGQLLQQGVELSIGTVSLIAFNKLVLRQFSFCSQKFLILISVLFFCLL